MFHTIATLASAVLRVTAILCAAAAFVLAQSNAAFAQRPCDDVAFWHEMRLDQKRLLALLRERKLDQLETITVQRQRDYESGNYREENLFYTFEAFEVNDPGILPLLIEWTKKYPKSYGARLALAVHRIGLAWAARGDKFIAETSQEQIDLFRRRSRAAGKDLLISRPLASKPITYFTYAIANARNLGEADLVQKSFNEALSLDPGAVMVRSRYVDALDPRWGGSFDELDRFKNQIASQALDASSKSYLSFRVEQTMARAHWAWKAHDQAERHFTNAAQHCHLPRAWQDLANLYNDTGQWRKAVDALESYLKLEPDQAWAIRRKAYALQELGEQDKAAPLYREAAQLGDAYAQNAYGWYLLEGIGIRRDVDEATKWFRAAAQQGNLDAAANLKRAAELKGR